MRVIGEGRGGRSEIPRRCSSRRWCCCPQETKPEGKPPAGKGAPNLPGARVSLPFPACWRPKASPFFMLVKNCRQPQRIGVYRCRSFGAGSRFTRNKLQFRTAAEAHRAPEKFSLFRILEEEGGPRQKKTGCTILSGGYRKAFRCERRLSQGQTVRNNVGNVTFSRTSLCAQAQHPDNDSRVRNAPRAHRP